MKFNNHPVAGDRQIAEAFNRYFFSQFISQEDDSMSLDFSNALHNDLNFTLDYQNVALALVLMIIKGLLSRP